MSSILNIFKLSVCIGDQEGGKLEVEKHKLHQKFLAIKNLIRLVQSLCLSSALSKRRLSVTVQLNFPVRVYSAISSEAQVLAFSWLNCTFALSMSAWDTESSLRTTRLTTVSQTSRLLFILVLQHSSEPLMWWVQTFLHSSSTAKNKAFSWLQ